MTTHCKALALVVGLTLLPLAVSAQTVGEPPSSVRMRIGPLFINPTLNLSNAGTDTNVFNDPKDPKQDFTVTISPGTDLWLRFGRTWVQGNINEDIVWFQKFASERSANNSYSLKWIVPLNRLTVTPTWTYVNTRERPGFEIDARAEHTVVAYAATADFRLFTKTSVSAQGQRTSTSFQEGTTFRGTDLQNELSRTSTAGTLSLRHQLTPLTSFSVGASLSQDRFDGDHLRDSDSLAGAVSMRFDPAALLKGGVSFGYRDFKPLSPTLPAYKGSTLAADLSYVLLGVTKMTLTAGRDVQYSYDVNQPYYLQTSMGGSINQQLFGPIDVVARAGLARLEYRNREGVAVVVPDRTDRTQSYGAGVGYHLGRDMRIGVNADHSKRDSAVALNQYQGWTYGLAITYSTGSGS